jgi:hypothetical protein
MKFEERAAIIEKLNLWEKKYPVDTWMIEGVHIWPILKKDIFFNLYRKFNLAPVKNKSLKKSILKRIFNKISRKPKAWLYLKNIKIEKVNFLFSGAPTFRVNWEDKQFNRYFDPIMDYMESKGEKPYLLEYSKVELKDVYKSSRVIDLTKVKPIFFTSLNFDKAWSHLMVSPGFTGFFKEMVEETVLTEKELKNGLLKNVQVILGWANLYEYFLKQMKVKYIFGLCYYNQPMTGMNLAAKKLGVISIDIQHGAQGDLHCAYYYNKIPKGGYNTLPAQFWLWDLNSFKNISKWTVNKYHFPILGGNPWIEFLKDDSMNEIIYGETKPMILFTLQPLNPIIDDYFLEVISLTCQKYNWWLRLHPRMTKEEVTGLNIKLDEFKIKRFVNIEEASREPLPLLLKECSLHVSKYSGSIAEAALMQKPTLIIDEIGVKSFEDLIKSRLAVACLTKNPAEIIELVENILNNLESHIMIQGQGMATYKTIIDEFIKKSVKQN